MLSLLQRGISLVLLSLVAAAGFPFLLKAESPSRSSPPRVAGKGAPGSLQEWRAVKKAAEEAMAAPRGPQRIGACEAFLAKHPHDANVRAVLRVLIDDILDTKAFDSGHVAQLLERLGKPEEEGSGFLPIYLVSRYYFKHHLPLESAEKLLRWGREFLARERAALEKEPDPKAREQRVVFDPQFRLELNEGRVLLARGDAAGALKKLLEAEATARAAGQIMTLRDSGRSVTAEFPSHQADVDWLNVSLAEAHRRLGDRPAARARLGRVGNFAAYSFAEIDQAVAKLRKDLKVPAPPSAETRSDPQPAPDFTLEDLEGKRIRLSDYRGKVVLVMLWTTW